MTMDLPFIPTVDSVPFPAGHIVTADEMNALAYCCEFAMNKPYTRVHATSTQSITTVAACNFDTVDQDADGMYASANPGRLTIHTPGYYKGRYMVNVGNVGANAYMKVTTGLGNPAGSGVSSSGAPYEQWGSYCLGTSGGGGGCGAQGILKQYLYAGDYVQVMFTRPAGSMVTVLNDVGSWFSLEWVSI